MSRLVPVNLIYLPLEGREFFICGEPNGLPRNRRRFRSTYLAYLWRKIIRAYESFKDRFDHNENVLAHLRHAETIRLVVPPDLKEEEARSHVRRFLHSGRSKHLRWLVVDALLASLGALLTPVPGPNLFFFYPAARALSHYFAYQGAMRAEELGIEEFRNDNLLEELRKGAHNLDEIENEVQELGKRYKIRQPQRLFRRLLEKL